MGGSPILCNNFRINLRVTGDAERGCNVILVHVQIAPIHLGRIEPPARITASTKPFLRRHWVMAVFR